MGIKVHNQEELKTSTQQYVGVPKGTVAKGAVLLMAQGSENTKHAAGTMETGPACHT